jgi:hypothetical protein
VKWDAARAIASIELPSRSIRERLEIAWR